MQRFVLSLPLVAITCLAVNVGHPGITLVRVPDGGLQAQLAVEPGGLMDLLYFSGDPKSGNLFLVRSKDQGKTFSRPLQVNSQAGSVIALGTIRGGQIAVGSGGRIHVAWNGSSTALPPGPVNPSGHQGMPMLYTRLNDQGTAFEPQRNLIQQTFDLDGGGTVAADRDGNVFVAWHGSQRGFAGGEAGRKVWIAASRDSGKTFAAEAPAWNEPTGACGCCGMSIFAANDGTVFGLYRSATKSVHRDIYMITSRDHGRSFDGSMVHPWEVNGCPMSSMSFTESGGTTFAAWETGGQVLYGKVFGSKVTAPIAAPGDAKGRKHPRIAVNGRGETMLVWTEGTGWQRGGTLSWQLFDAAGKAIGEKGGGLAVPAWSFAAVAARPDGSFVIVY